MQENNQTDFDFLVKSALEDAEVKPSKRAWENISARLDESGVAATSRNTPVWYKWAGVSLAVAACVAAGVVFINPNSSDNELTLTKIDIPMAMAETSSEGVLLGRRNKTSDTPYYYHLTSASEAKAAEEVVPEDETAGIVYLQNEVPVLKEESGAESTVEQPKESSPAELATTDTFETDPFSLMEEEDRKATRSRAAKGRTAIYAKGSVSGNDSGLARIQSIPSMAPGKGSSGFSELSTSTYGVPFSVGLGVRFYVLNKLSIGTGVEYSLLTRTFTGKYTEVDSDGTTTREEAGDVSHKVQYLGVPLNLYYDLFNAKPLKLYVYGGGSGEVCVSNKYTMYTNPRVSSSVPVEKLQFSVGVGIGLEFSVAKHLSLYIDPSMRYYFPSDQPKSVRTDKPLMVNLDAGVRFIL